MPLLDLFDHPIWQRWAMTLVHFLWQGTAIVLILVLLLKVLRITTAQGRYAAHLAALVTLALCPLVTFAWIESVPRQAFTRQASVVDPSLDAANLLPPAAPASLQLTETASLSEAARADATAIAGVAGVAHAAPTADVSSPAPAPSRLTIAGPWIASFWVLGVVLLSLRLIAGVAFLQRLRVGRTAPPAHIARILQRLAAAMGMARVPGLHGCSVIDEPAATGILRPVILVPAAWLAQMPAEMLEAIIAHELAHIRRFDLWANLFQRIVETVLFFHPATWWLSSRIRAEREVCCDEIAIAVTREKLVYVNTLEFIARTRLTRLRPALAVHMGGTHMALLQRVRHVLGRSSPAAEQSTRGWVGGLAALAVPVVLAGSSLFIAPAGADDVRGEPTPPPRDRERERPRAEGEREKPRPVDGDRGREKPLPAAERPPGAAPYTDAHDNRDARRQAQVKIAAATAMVRDSEAELTAQQAQFQKSQRDLERALTLRKNNAISEAELDDVQTANKVSAARLQASEGRLAHARAVFAAATTEWNELDAARREVERPRDPAPVREDDRPRDGDRVRNGDRARDGDRPRDDDRPRDGDKPRAADRAWTETVMRVKAKASASQMALVESEAGVEIAKATADLAARTQERMLALRKQQTVSEEEADRAVTAFRVAAAQLQAAQARREAARAGYQLAAQDLKSLEEMSAARDPGGPPRAAGGAGMMAAERRPVAASDQEELIKVIRELRSEVEQLRREVEQMRGQRGDRGAPRETPRAIREPERQPGEGDRQRDGERRGGNGRAPAPGAGVPPTPRAGDRIAPPPVRGERLEGTGLPPAPPAEEKEGHADDAKRPPAVDPASPPTPPASLAPRDPAPVEGASDLAPPPPVEAKIER